MAGAVASTKAPNTMIERPAAGETGHAGSCWILDQFPAVFAATSRTITTAASQMPAGSTSAASTTTSGSEHQADEEHPQRNLRKSE